jgi:hypothetical protein
VGELNIAKPINKNTLGQLQGSCHQPPLTTYDTATKDLMIEYYQRLNAAAWENSGLYRPIIMVYYPRYIWRTVQCTP